MFRCGCRSHAPASGLGGVRGAREFPFWRGTWAHYLPSPLAVGLVPRAAWGLPEWVVQPTWVPSSVKSPSSPAAGCGVWQEAHSIRADDVSSVR